MVAVILHAARLWKLVSPKYSVFLVAVALCNLMVWAVEQFIDIDFEFLSVSYIVTEVMLLLIYGVLRDYGIVQPGGNSPAAPFREFSCVSICTLTSNPPGWTIP